MWSTIKFPRALSTTPWRSKREMVSFTHRPLSPRRRNTRNLLDEKMDGPQSRIWRWVPLLEAELQFLGRPAHSLVINWPWYCQESLCMNKEFQNERRIISERRSVWKWPRTVEEVREVTLNASYWVGTDYINIMTCAITISCLDSGTGEGSNSGRVVMVSPRICSELKNWYFLKCNFQEQAWSYTRNIYIWCNGDTPAEQWSVEKRLKKEWTNQNFS